MKKLISNITKFVFSIGLGVLLIWLSVRNLEQSDINEMRNALKHVSWLWLILGTLIGMASSWVRAERWNMLLRSMGYKAKIANVAAAVYIMYIGNIIFPRLGEITRCGIVYKTDSVPLEKSIGTMVVERAVDMITLLLVGISLFFLQYDMLKSVFDKYIITPLALKYENMSVISIVVLFLTLFFAVGIGLWAFKRFNFGFLDVLKDKLMGLWHGLIAIRKVESPFLFIIYSVLIWAMYLMMGVCTLKGVEATSHLGFNASLVILFFGTFAFIATQGGVGAYPIIAREILLLFGISANVGYAWGWIAWSIQTAFMVLFGLASFAYLVWNVKTTKKQGEISTNDNY
jgi:hypothetical protein